jgi:pyruvate decarboxylase
MGREYSLLPLVIFSILTSVQAIGRFLRPGDFVISETGTSSYGITASKVPTGASMYNQTIFGSIGYATGAAVGAFKAIKENGKYKRCILITGEGSLQLTAQAYADVLKLALNPIM